MEGSSPASRFSSAWLSAGSSRSTRCPPQGSIRSPAVRVTVIRIPFLFDPVVVRDLPHDGERRFPCRRMGGEDPVLLGGVFLAIAERFSAAIGDPAARGAEHRLGCAGVPFLQ